jgi:hypothetical protein
MVGCSPNYLQNIKAVKDKSAIPNLKKGEHGEGICGKVTGKISLLEGRNDQTTDFEEHHSWFSRSMGSSPRHTQIQQQHSIRGN